MLINRQVTLTILVILSLVADYIDVLFLRIRNNCILIKEKVILLRCMYRSTKPSFNITFSNAIDTFNVIFKLTTNHYVIIVSLIYIETGVCFSSNVVRTKSFNFV